MAKNSAAKFDNKEQSKLSLLDLPESTLDCILEYLLPVDLCNVAKVCTALRYRCRRNGLWEILIKQKWGGILGDNANREWQYHVRIIENKESEPLLQLNNEGLLGCFSGKWPQLSLGSYLENPWDLTSLLMSSCSMMALYISLHSGRFWFPAQVYGTIKVYDALLSYNYTTSTFRVRSQSGGWHVIEENVTWDRLRISPVETTPYALHISECLNDLKPGDHIEIQRRRHNEQPYEWFYAVIDHLESCNKDHQNHCCECKYSDMVMVFFQFPCRPRPTWKRVVLNRNVCGEQSDSFWLYGGIRKLDYEEMDTWTRIRASRRPRDFRRIHVS